MEPNLPAPFGLRLTQSKQLTEAARKEMTSPRQNQTQTLAISPVGCVAGSPRASTRVQGCGARGRVRSGSHWPGPQSPWVQVPG